MNIIVRPHGSDICHCRPDTTWERENRDFYSPECVNEILWTPVVFARVCKAGKCIGSNFVERYYDGVGCGILLYCMVVSSHGPAGVGSMVECADHTSILPMPLYDAMVMDSEINEYGVKIGGLSVPIIGNDGIILPEAAKGLLEETICRASELTSLRTGDLVAAELGGRRSLSSKDADSVSIKGVFCKNEIFDINVIF